MRIGELQAPDGTLIFFDIQPDPRVVANELLALANYYDEPHVPLAAAAAIGRDNIKERFSTQTDPEGNEWKPLTQKYVKAVRDGQTDPILHLSGELERTATDIDAWMIEGNSLFFDTGGMPEYWAWNNFGAGEGNFGRGEFIEGANLKGPGQALPQREFLRLDNRASAKINRTFDQWFDAGVDTFVRSSGHLQTRIGGKFGPLLKDFKK